MAPAAILVTDEGDGVIVIAYDRSEAMNALDQASAARLIRVMRDVADRRDVRAVVFTGAGRAFCSGLDLSEGAGGIAAMGLFKRSLDVAGPMRNPHQIWISAVNGVVAGAGLGFALAADIVLAADSATFTSGFSNMGLGPDSGVSWFAVKRMGYSAALDFCLFGRKWDAERARRAGMVDHVVPYEALAAAAFEKARAIATRGDEEISALKQAMGRDFDFH